MAENGMWEKLKPASYQADGYPEVRFPVVEQEKAGGLRLARRRRPYRAGSRLDSVGRKEREWTVQAIFHNDIEEDGLGDVPQLWPDRINELELQLETGLTGTLHLPWERNLRVKADSWRRRASPEMTDGEAMTITFVEDTEDQVMGDAIDQVSVRSQASRLAEEAQFDADADGGWDGSFEDFQELAADLEGALNAPGELLDDVKHKAGRVRRAAESIHTSIASRAGGDDPEHERVLRKLNQIRDAVAGAEGEAAGRSRRIVTRTFPTDRDIYDIAASLGQNATELMAINGHIEDLSSIPAGTPVKVYA